MLISQGTALLHMPHNDRLLITHEIICIRSTGDDEHALGRAITSAKKVERRRLRRQMEEDFDEARHHYQLSKPLG
jgi:hypothetical protein